MIYMSRNENAHQEIYNFALIRLWSIRLPLKHPVNLSLRGILTDHANFYENTAREIEALALMRGQYLDQPRLAQVLFSTYGVLTRCVRKQTISAVLQRTISNCTECLEYIKEAKDYINSSDRRLLLLLQRILDREQLYLYQLQQIQLGTYSNRTHRIL